MTQHPSLISFRLHNQTLRQIRRLTTDQQRDLLEAYPPPTNHFKNRSAILRALIQCGLQAIDSPKFPRILKEPPCPSGTPPHRPTSDVADTA